MKKKRLATVSLFLILILSLSLLFGCSAQKTTDNSNVAPGSDQGYGNEESKGSTSTGTSGENDDITGDRKVIFTASLKIETTHYENSIAILEKMIGDFDGYIQNSSVEVGESYQNSSGLRYASYTIRIPSKNLTAFMSKTGDIGNVVLNSTKGEDVTDQFYDTKAHLEALTIQEDRLLELLKTATTLKDILDLEDRLSEVRYEIEQLTGLLNKLSSLIDMSTVTIEINEVETITTPEPEGFWAQIANTFTKSIDALVNTLRVLSLVIVAILPFIIVFGLIALAVILIYRRTTRKRRLAAKQQYAAWQANQGFQASGANAPGTFPSGQPGAPATPGQPGQAGSTPQTIANAQDDANIPG